MKKNMLINFLIVSLSLMAFSSASAFTITFEDMPKSESDDDGGGTTLTSPETWATVWDFNSGSFDTDRPAVFDSYKAKTAAIVSDSDTGYAAPAQTDLTSYLAIPDPDSGEASGEITFGLSGYNTYLGLYWGSIDTYNSITFYADGSSLTLSGDDIVGEDANGNQVEPPSNPYVNIYGLDPFDSFRLSSTNRAFEVDNLAVGTPVPEPATFLLMGLGLVGLAGIQRKRKKAINS